MLQEKDYKPVESYQKNTKMISGSHTLLNQRKIGRRHMLANQVAMSTASGHLEDLSVQSGPGRFTLII
jgi:hypothetical protein